ncbi:MAG: tRNA lysidine(34) synthetase TilS, partial [Pseudomonadota bacterium]|nr:tRNA lysidine(34) synthetase TilS [Pseudomonadota bacterium]
MLIALSGGLDSIVLLHLLSQHQDISRDRVQALHIHHGLHADAAQWTTHCQQLCNAIGVPLQVVNVEVARDAGEGLEAAARKARYAAFTGAMGDGDVLVTAHHRDDQAETFLLRALRASGPDGLASMRPWRPFAHGWHWRPLLETPRAALLAYARQNALVWIDDSSNLDTIHDRNFLRHEIMPLLRRRWPQVDAAFARSASLSADAAGLLADEDARALATARAVDAHLISTHAFKQLPAARRARVLRRWVAELGLPPLPSEGVEQVESQLLVAQHDTEAAFEWSGAVIRRWRDVLHADMRRDALPVAWRTEWNGASPLDLPTGDQLRLIPFVPQGGFLRGVGAASAASSGIDAFEDSKLAIEAARTKKCPAFDLPLVVHARHGGERIILPGREHS